MPNVLQRIVPQENMDTPWTMSHLSYRLWTNMSWTFWHYSYKRTEPFHNSTNILKYFNHVRQLFNASWTSSVLPIWTVKAFNSLWSSTDYPKQSHSVVQHQISPTNQSVVPFLLLLMLMQWIALPFTSSLIYTKFCFIMHMLIQICSDFFISFDFMFTLDFIRTN